MDYSFFFAATKTSRLNREQVKVTRDGCQADGEAMGGIA
jgi:hypothetical protein